MRLWSRVQQLIVKAQPAAFSPIEILRQSQLIDAAWYLQTYPDVASAGLDPVDHYYASGATEGRNPNPLFDSHWYMAANSDVREAKVNPLLHFVLSGAKEGRSAGPEFDTAYYLAENPDIFDTEINPLLHYLRYGKSEGRISKPRDDMEVFEVGMRAKKQGLTGAAAALFRGPRSGQVHFMIPQWHAAVDPADIQLPPLSLVQRNGLPTLEDFNSSGSSIRDTIVRALPNGFSWEGAHCLDFGSGLGRVLRHFGEESESAEFWGCEVDGPNVRWCIENLSPRFKFLQINDIPAMPFEDNYFDLVYAISIYRNIYINWRYWLMEIRRILKPGGVLFISFFGQTPFEENFNNSNLTQSADLGMYITNPYSNFNAGESTIFVSPAWIKATCGNLFNIEFISADDLPDYQSFSLMRKPVSELSTEQAVPLLKLGTTQIYNPHAIGRIEAQINMSLPYRESFGLDLKAGDAAVVRGWIVFRDDRPAQMEVLVDGQRVQALPNFEIGDQYRDWENSPCAIFSVHVDLSSIDSGVHKLQICIFSLRSLTHSLTIPLLLR